MAKRATMTRVFLITYISSTESEIRDLIERTVNELCHLQSKKKASSEVERARLLAYDDH